MKRFLYFILVLCPAFSFSKELVFIDGIRYVLNSQDKTAEVTSYAGTGLDDYRGYKGDIVIPERVTYNEIQYDVTSIGDGAFDISDGLISVTLPNSVTSIGHGAFKGSRNLSSITFGNKVSAIGNSAFQETGLNSVTLPNSVISIGDCAFSFCKLKTVTIFSSSIYLGGQCFSCNQLEDVYCYTETVPTTPDIGLPQSLFDGSNATLHVHDYAIEAFKSDENWRGFKNIVPFEKMTDFNLIYKVDGEEYKTVKYKYDDEITPEAEPTKKGMTFLGWSGMPEKMPGKDVNVTGLYTWSKDTIGCVIYEVSDTINNNAAVIGSYKASGEVKIVSPVKFDYDYCITDIVDFSFKNNTEITSVVIPESVMKIGDEAFYGCKNLTKIELGKSVNQIEPRAFAGIDKLTDVICYAEDLVPDADRTAFENSYIEDYVTLHVPAASIDKYKEVAPWKNFKSIVSVEGTEPPQTFKLIYMVDGEVYKTVEIEEGAEITPEAEPTKEGYTFSGWSDMPEIMPSEDVTILGTFTINKYTITYYVDGEVYKTYEIEYGADVTPEEEPTKDGYVFSGWSEIPDVMPSEDVTITGTFTEDTSEGDDVDNPEEGDDVVNPEEGDTDETNVGEEVIPISGAKQTTWCSAYDLDFTGVEGVKAYIASGYDRETGIIWLTRVNKVPAGEGILIIADKGDYTIPHVSTSAYYANLMVGTLKAMVLNETDGEYTNYYLSNGTSGVGFYKVNGSVDIKANRAYLPLLKNEISSSRGFIGLDFDDGEDGTTGIRNTMQTTEKDVWYNLQGQRVNNPGRGLYIRNGKKIFVR